MTKPSIEIPFIQDADEYQAWAEKTKAIDYEAIAERFGVTIFDPSAFTLLIDLLHGVLGKVTELGELADPLKKHIFYGKPLDFENMREEMGDGLWYDAACIAPALQTSMSTEMTENIRKLAKRYPDQLFSEGDAIMRADKQEPWPFKSKHVNCVECWANDFTVTPREGQAVLIVCENCGTEVK